MTPGETRNVSPGGAVAVFAGASLPGGASCSLWCHIPSGVGAVWNLVHRHVGNCPADHDESCRIVTVGQSEAERCPGAEAKQTHLNTAPPHADAILWNQSAYPSQSTGLSAFKIRARALRVAAVSDALLHS